MPNGESARRLASRVKEQWKEMEKTEPASKKGQLSEPLNEMGSISKF